MIISICIWLLLALLRGQKRSFCIPRISFLISLQLTLVCGRNMMQNHCRSLYRMLKEELKYPILNSSKYMTDVQSLPKHPPYCPWFIFPSCCACCIASPYHNTKKVIVPLVYMNHLPLMYLHIALLFVYHKIQYLFPSLVWIVMTDCIVDHGDVASGYLLSDFFQFSPHLSFNQFINDCE